LYALTVEEGSRLARQNRQPDEDRFERFWDMSDAIVGAAGLHRYEISNFAKAEERCRHNWEVWHGGTYLGCGPAAASFDGRLRRTNPASLNAWLRGDSPQLDELPPTERAAEILAFGMRTLDGWTWEDFERQTGYDAKSLRGSQIDRLQRKGLIVADDKGMRPTRLGLLFNDDVLMELL
jgi:oxygen-independent coproporphyrinogen-3 oxidase